METHVVIMAGGIGSRFWPMSTPDYPKQFIDVLGCGKTLIQMTVDRFTGICPIENFWVVTSRLYVPIVKEQLPGIPAANILAEPEGRNTAPCIAYACWKIRLHSPHANIVVTPSDAFVQDTVEYQRIIRRALAYTEVGSNIVTVGIKPTRPETGYGYIETGAVAADEVLKVSSFKEKPDIETAKSYLQGGGYLWNAGIFVWNCETIVSAIRQFVPDIAELMDRMAESFYTSDEDAVVGELFPQCRKISIDYAVMEHSDSIYTLPGDFGWSDLGTWGSLRINIPHDAADNAVVAAEGTSVHLYDSRGCVVHVSNLHHVVLEGLQDCIVAEKDGSLLVCRLSSEQHIKEFEK